MLAPEQIPETTTRAFSIIDVLQRSAEWFRARCALLTASDAAAMLAKIENGEAAARRDLRTRLVCERLTNEPQEGAFQSADMKRGIELEADAFAAYEAVTGTVARVVGFLRHNTLRIGCSPDGIIGDFEGGLELKVPRSATHLRYWRAGVAGAEQPAHSLPCEHVAQVTHSLYVTGLPFWDFVSFDPRFPRSMQLFRVRVRGEDVDLKAYEVALTLFLSEVEQEFEEVSRMAETAVA